MMRTRLIVGLCLVSLLGMVACDDDAVFVPPSNLPLTAEETADVIESFILPAVQLIGLLNPFVLLPPQRSTLAESGLDVCDVQSCPSGSVEVCLVNPLTEEFSLDFDACEVVPGVVVDGTMLASGQMSETSTSLEASLNLTLTTPADIFSLNGGAEFSGSDTVIALTADNLRVAALSMGFSAMFDGQLSSSLVSKGCLSQSASDLSVNLMTPESTSFSADGTLVYCPRQEFPTGGAILTFIGEDGDFRQVLDMDAATLDIFDLSSSLLLMACEIDLPNSVETTCECQVETCGEIPEI